MERISSSLGLEVAPTTCSVLGVVYGAAAVRERAKEKLAMRLLEALARQAPTWAGAVGWGPVRLSTTSWGQPRLYLGEKAGPGISFSRGGERLWGALAAQGQVGIDVALYQEFIPPYPYQRAFLPDEWDWAVRHCQGREPAAAALLWAAKEAAVKARGTGFHTIDFLDVTVSPPSPADGGLLLTVCAPEPVTAWARTLPDAWLALAAG